MVHNIEALRGIAAVVVALYHLRIGLTGMTDPTLQWIHRISEFGAVGLDLFFVVSGVVMVISTQNTQGGVRDALRFMIRRLFRIVPLYWACVAAMVCIIYLAFGVLPAQSEIFKSISFQYFDILAAKPDYPIYMPGWTLTFELFFYSFFAVEMFVARRRRLFFIPGILMALSLLGCSGLVHRPDHSFVKFILHPLHLEFVYGIFLGIAYKNDWFRFPYRVAIYSALIGISMVILMFAFEISKEINPFSGGILVVVVVSCALLMEQSKVFVFGRVWLWLGRISYSVYLMHLIVFNSLTLMLVQAGQQYSQSEADFLTYRFIVYLMSLVLTLVVASITNRYIEGPFQKLGKNLSGKI